MKLFRSFLLGIGILTLVGCHSQPLSKTRVILISIDAFRPDYLQRGMSPNLNALAASGVRAQWMIPSFPTKTYPNHYAMVTGLYPDHNGVVGNDMEADGMRSVFTRREGTWNPEWFDEATPIWTSVQQAGGRSAVLFWPGSDAPNHGLRPDRRYPYDISISADRRMSIVLGWLEDRPNFTAIYFDKVDYQGHLHGPDSPEVNHAIRTIDAQIGRLVAALKKRGTFDNTDIIVVSDHGMAPVEQIIYLDQFFDESNAHALMSGGIAGVNANPGKKLDARKLLAPHSHMQCWWKRDIPPRFHYGENARVPQVICLARPGWLIMTHAAAAKKTYTDRGTHGYDNSAPSMRSLFIAEGPDFKRGYVAKPFPNVDIYLLLTHLLNVSPEHNDGNLDDVKPMLNQGAASL